MDCDEYRENLRAKELLKILSYLDVLKSKRV